MSSNYAVLGLAMAAAGVLTDVVGARAVWIGAGVMYLVAAARRSCHDAMAAGRDGGGGRSVRGELGVGGRGARATVIGIRRRTRRRGRERHARAAARAHRGDCSRRSRRVAKPKRSRHVVAPHRVPAWRDRELTLEELIAGVRGGDRRALARAISLVEDGDALAYPLVRELYPETGRARVVGVTGPPGVGQVEPDRRARRATSASASRRLASSRSIRRARSRAARSSAIGSASPITSSIPASSSARWARAGISAGWPRRAAGRAAPRRGRQGRRVRRDGRSRAERGRGHRDRGHRAPRPHARLGRLRAGAEGRDHGDPGRDRDQQDGSRGGEDDAQRGALDRRPGGARASGPTILLTERARRGERAGALGGARGAPCGARERRSARGAPAKESRGRGVRGGVESCECASARRGGRRSGAAARARPGSRSASSIR